MEYKVGSLADMISGSTKEKKVKKMSSSSKKDVKIKFENVEPATAIVNVKTSKKRKLKAINGSASSKVKKLNDGSPAVVPGVRPKRLKKRDYARDESGVVGETKKSKHVLDPEQETRTIFVGNLVKKTSKYNLKNLFSKYGKVETVRLRSAPIADPRVPKKVAVIKGEFHPDRTNINAYVRFESVESAEKALAANGLVINGHTIRVDMAAGGGKINSKKGIFVGNIKFTVTEEDLRKVFEGCGDIHSIRLVRDKKTGMGKGIAFVNFEESEAVELALALDGEELEKRPIRVSRCTTDNKLKAKKKKNTIIAVKTIQNIEKTGKKKRKLIDATIPAKISVVPASDFQGQEIVDQKVKKLKKLKLKKNKSEKKKKVMLHKLEITPKSKNKKLRNSVST